MRDHATDLACGGAGFVGLGLDKVLGPGGNRQQKGREEREEVHAKSAKVFREMV